MEHRELTLGVLKRAREILSDPARWTKYVYARVPEPEEVCDHGLELVARPDATCFCGLGSLARAAVELSGQEALSPSFDLDHDLEHPPRDEVGALLVTDHELASLRASVELRTTLLRSGRVPPPSWLLRRPGATVKDFLPWVQFPAFNDNVHTTHADVLEVFDETIARLEADRG